MMRYAFVMTLALAALLAAACRDGEPAERRGSPPASSAAARPQPAAPVPEGALLVQKQNPRPETFALDSGGNVTEWGRGFSYVTSPGGEHVAFLRGERQDRPDEVVIAEAGGDETFADRAEEPAVNSPYPWLIWSPDGSRLAYSLPGGGRPDENHVYVVDADRGGRRRLTQEPGAHTLLGWTDDGRVLAQDGRELLLLGETPAALDLPAGVRALKTYLSFLMSPDGKRVALYGGESESEMQMWAMEIADGRAKLLVHAGRLALRPAPERYVSAAPPAGPAITPAAAMKGPPPLTWSPDGRRIAYYRIADDAEGHFGWELRVVDVDSGADVVVTKEGTWSASWSPDGRYLAETGESAVYVYDTAGGGLRSVALHAARAVWTANGKLVALAPGKSSIIEPGDGAVRELTGQADLPLAGMYAFETVPSPDGRYLAVGTTADYFRANGSLAVIDTHSGELTLVVEKGSFLPVAWLPSHP